MLPQPDAPTVPEDPQQEDLQPIGGFASSEGDRGLSSGYPSSMASSEGDRGIGSSLSNDVGMDITPPRHTTPPRAMNRRGNVESSFENTGMVD
jgi:hypothetical protein